MGFIEGSLNRLSDFGVAYCVIKQGTLGNNAGILGGCQSYGPLLGHPKY